MKRINVKHLVKLAMSSMAVYGIIVGMVIVLCVGVLVRVSYSLRDEIDARGGLRQSLVDVGRNARSIMDDIKTDDPNEQPDPNSMKEQQ